MLVVVAEEPVEEEGNNLDGAGGSAVEQTLLRCIPESNDLYTLAYLILLRG